MASKYNQKGDPDAYNRLDQLFKKKEFPRILVLYGPETEMLLEYRFRLRRALTPGAAEEFNLHKFSDDNWDVLALQDAVDAIPVFGESSLIEIWNINPFQAKRGSGERQEGLSEDERTKLTEILSDLPDYCTVAFYFEDSVKEWKPDKRMKALYAPFQSCGLTFQLGLRERSDLRKWIDQTLLKDSGKKISDENKDFLIKRCGSSMANIRMETEKLISYSAGTEITRDDMELLLLPMLEESVFSITDHIIAGSFSEAVNVLRDVMSREKDSAIPICAALGRQYRTMYAVSVLTENRMRAEQLTSIWPGTRDFVCRKAATQAKNYRKHQLKRAMELCMWADDRLKSGSNETGEAVLTDLLLRLSHLEMEVPL